MSYKKERAKIDSALDKFGRFVVERTTASKYMPISEVRKEFKRGGLSKKERLAHVAEEGIISSLAYALSGGGSRRKKRRSRKHTKKSRKHKNNGRKR